MRRADLDALRIILCAAVILQHAVLIFAAEPRYHVKSAVISPSASAAYEILRIIAMPPFFTLAGWAAVLSLRCRGVAAFCTERASRLLLPLAAGILLLGPVIKYIELSGGRDLSLSGFRLVPPLRMGFPEFLGDYYGRLALLTWSHLWFLAYLLLYSVLLLPLLVWLARRPLRSRVPSAALVYLPVLPLMGVLAGWHGYWPYLPNLLTDGTNATYFAVCFVLGAGIAVWPGFESRLRDQATRLALLAVAGMTVVLACGESLEGRLAVGTTAWCFIAAAWGFAMRWKPRRSAVLVYLTQASLPVYILHHLPLLLVGRWVLTLGIPAWPAIGLIVLSATAMSFALYHWLIRPFTLGRLLTGMHPVCPTGRSTASDEQRAPVMMR
jgi:peptidoglycan/LPS O-acetylase OafA/YrhL